MPRMSDQHYQQGRAVYDAHGSLYELIVNSNALDQREQAEHQAVDAAPDADPLQNRNEQHHEIADRYRDAGPSLIAGFADGVLLDLRRVIGRRGQTA